MISLDDVKKGVWKPNPVMAAFLTNGSYQALVEHALHYCEQLKLKGRYTLMVWPYHGMLAGIGHALVPAFEEACFFHAVARGVQTGFEIKGGNSFFENYSVFGGEVMTTKGNQSIPGAQKNVKFLERLMKNDAVFIFGQAKSHCLAWTIEDLLTDIMAKDASLAEKVYIMKDCTSPVVTPAYDFTDDANKAFERFEAAGMHVVKSTDPIWTWPGINL
jgi:nicotinamidase-related amidase